MKKFFILIFSILCISLTVCAQGIEKSIALQYIDGKGRLQTAKEVAISNDKGVYIPLSLVEAVSPYSFKKDSQGVHLLWADSFVKDKEIIISDYKKGQWLDFPTTTINNKLYVNLTHVNEAIGLRTQRHTSLITLIPYGKTRPIKERKPLGKVNLLFDPVSSYKYPYEGRLLEGFDHIMSPSWYVLTNKVLSVQKSFSPQYGEIYRERGYHVWPLVNNDFDPRHTRAFLEDKSKWTPIVNELIYRAKLYNYDGYNFDFENLFPEDKDKFTEFIAYAYKEMKGHGLYVSLDVPPLSNSLRWSQVYDRKGLADHSDYILLMAYDETPRTSKKGGPNSSLTWVERQVKGLAAIVPKEKILLGLPLYTRIWTDGKGQTLSLVESRSYFKDDTYKDFIKWNDTWGLYYLEKKVDKKLTQIWFEEEKSLQLKLDLVNAYHLGGVGFWRKGFEDSQLWKELQVNRPPQIDELKQKTYNKRK